MSDYTAVSWLQDTAYMQAAMTKVLHGDTGTRQACEELCLTSPYCSAGTQLVCEQECPGHHVMALDRSAVHTGVSILPHNSGGAW